MLDIFERIKENPGPLGQFADYGEGYFIFPRLEGPIGPRMQFQGREVIFWSANDYLGLCNHPEVIEADAKRLQNMECSILWEQEQCLEKQISTFSWKELADFVQKNQHIY
jgi:glycine C-acetyltransferase